MPICLLGHVRPRWGLITNHRSCFHLDDDDDFGGVVGVAADESQHVDAQLARRFLGDGHREHVAERPTFFAVGAGHLPGEKGLLQLLRNAGYTVEGQK